MTLQRKLLFGFSLMVLPALLVGVEAIRSKSQEDRALEALRQGLTRARTYAEVETAMFNESEVVWRYLSGMEPDARREFSLHGEVVDFWLDRWSTELRPDERELEDAVRSIQSQIQSTGQRVFALYDAGQRKAAYAHAHYQLKRRLLPALTELNHEIYRRARELSVKRAFARLEEIVETDRRILLSITALSLVAGLLIAWLISRSLAHPINQLGQAMAIVGAGDLDHPIDARSADEIGDLARAFARMTESLRQSRADMVRLNLELETRMTQLQRAQAQLVQSEKLASIGEVAAAVAHGMRNPLSSLRAAAQLALRHPESPAAREQLSSIVQEVDRLDQRVAHLLSFSRPAPFHPLRENVSPLVEGLLPGFAELIRARGLELELDLAPALVETARRLASEAGLSIRYDVGDAERLPYEDASFDVVSSNIGAMFAPDHAAVADELARVCRPGGRLGLTCWKPEGGVADIFKLMRPFQPPPPPGVGSPFDWGRREHVDDLLGAAFELALEEGDAPQLGESGEEIWELFSTSYGPTKTLADSLEPERREELHRQWVDFYEGFRVDGEIRQPRPYLLVLGRRR